MQTFVRVAELGSFAAVAVQLGVARSVVTRQVAALERQLGTRLLLRSTRQLSLTSAGAAYLEKCRVILNLVDAAEADLAAERAVARGRIRISLPLSFGLKRLAPLLLEFAAAQPEVQLEMDYTDRRVDLVQEGFDFALRITARIGEGDVVRRIGECRRLTVASPRYLALRGTPRSPADLAGHECLGYSGGGAGGWPFVVAGRVETMQVATRLDASNGDVLAEAAALGLGITQQPDFIVEPYLASGRLVEILAGCPPPPLGVYVMLPGTRHLPYRVRLLVDFLAARLRAAGQTGPRRGVAPGG